MAGSLLEFASAQLRSLLGFDEVEEVASYILTLDPGDVAMYLRDMLGDDAKAKGFAARMQQERCRPGATASTQVAPVASVQGRVDGAPAPTPAIAEHGSAPAGRAKMSQKERKRQQRT